MTQAPLRRGLSAAAALAALIVAACESGPSAAELEAQRLAAEAAARQPPPITLNEGVAEAASVYVAFLREAQTIQPGGFTDAESIQAAIRKGASFDPALLSRGLIAYGSIIALQSPEFVAGVQQYARDPVQRQEMVARIVADPAYAATLPGASAAAGLISQTISKDAVAIRQIADGIEDDAYTIQERQDPRRRWATAVVADREERLQNAKVLSSDGMLPSAEDAARLLASVHDAGAGLPVQASTREPPYTASITRSLAIAALAALGAAGDNARANTEALVIEQENESCLSMSKLMLFQCLAASRPSYEDMFCLGRHVTRDLATCTTEAVLNPRIFVSDPQETGATPASAAARTAVEVTVPPVQQTPVQVQPTPVPTPAPTNPTAALNTTPPSR